MPTPLQFPERRVSVAQDAVFSSDPAAAQFSSMFESAMQPAGVGVRVADVVTDQPGSGNALHAGSHPDANADGYVAYPRMNPAEDMVELLVASPRLPRGQRGRHFPR